MEVRTHARILSNSKWFIFVFTVFAGIAAFVFGLVRPIDYKAVVSFEVHFVDKPVSLEYQYGAYYELKAAEIFTQHLMSLMKTPAIVEEVYKEAGQGYEIDSIAQFTNRFQAKQYSAQNFSVIFNDRNQDTANKLATSVGKVITKHAETAGNVNGEQVFTVTALRPVVAESEFNVILVTAVGVLAGLIMSVILVYLREYFRE